MTITTLVVRDQDVERAVEAVTALIMRKARNTAGGGAYLEYDAIPPLSLKIVRLIGAMKIGCYFDEDGNALTKKVPGWAS